MDMRKYVLMKSLQREYYLELKSKRQVYKTREIFVYRLIIVLLLGILTGLLLH